MSLKNKIKTLVLSLTMALSLISCDNSFVYDQYTNLNGKWLATEPVIFEYEATDTITPYNYFITTRLNNEYPYNNLFLIVETQLPNKQISVDTVQYQMAATDGTILGKGLTDIKESKLWFKESVPFSEPGKHTFKISQAVRELGKVDGVQELKGITEIGFRIEKINNNNE